MTRWNYISLILLMIGLTACSERIAMTRDGYADVGVGMSVFDLQKIHGKPYTIYAKEDGSETYEYIERIYSGDRTLEIRHYYIVILDGKVIGKYVKVSSPPSYDAIYSESPYS